MTDSTACGHEPELCDALAHFLPEPQRCLLASFGSGNINDSWLVTQRSGERWLLQRLNSRVFPDAQAVMGNMRLVLAHLQRELTQIGRSAPDFKLFSLASSRDGSTSYRAPDGSWWRLLSYISDSCSLATITTPFQARELGRTLGLFHRLLAPLDANLLADPLPNFHNTGYYLQQYDRALGSFCAAPSPEVDSCVRFIDSHRALAQILENDKNLLSHQVIHGDPKVGNFLFAHEGQRVISLVDLDTLKPGLILHDIGDALRSCCTSAGEEAASPHEIRFNPALFQAWLQGYLGEFGFRLTKSDQERIVAATSLIAFELGLRFFTDYLNGNTYFKINFPSHNLRRARNQFHLAREVEEQAAQLTRDVQRIARITSA